MYLKLYSRVICTKDFWNGAAGVIFARKDQQKIYFVKFDNGRDGWVDEKDLILELKAKLKCI